ncbi:hypothetical protein RFI_01810, partial [Reticulomyxa filosa]
MFAQLRQMFPKIDEEIISAALKGFNQNIKKIQSLLTWLTENTIKIFTCSTNLQQQQYLMQLFKKFGNQFEKTTISQTWRNCNQIYVDTIEKLNEIFATSNLNELNVNRISIEENEFKILRRTCLHILWNILKYPKHIKYRQINNQALYSYLFSRCHTLDADFGKVFIFIGNNLQGFGFNKGNNDNWYYRYDHIQLLYLWNCYEHWINQQAMYCYVFVYKTRLSIPRRVCMLSNGKWKDYFSVFDYEHRTIMLFDKNKLKIKSLQLGNPKKSSLEFNINIQRYNDIDIDHTHAKWAYLILNHTWHFRTMTTVIGMIYQIVYQLMKVKHTNIFINYLLIELNSFHVIWKAFDNTTHRMPLNPYSMTVKEGIQHLQHNLQMRSHFIDGTDELIRTECKFDKWIPRISKMNDSSVLLHDIYKHLPHYPIIQVRWEIYCWFMVPYKRAIGIERNNIPKSGELDIEFTVSDQKPKFNPLLYERDLHKLKIIKDKVEIRVTVDNSLQKLLHEKKQLHEKIKQQINYNEKNKNGELILNDLILTILNELKILYHDDIHKQMGYPLQLWHICAILLYCGKSCN